MVAAGEPSSEIPAALRLPASGVPNDPPVSTREALLPFGYLTWENFERLCLRLVETDATVEYCARYGRQGQAQQGIDLYARKVSGRYLCWQAKRYKEISPKQFAKAIDLFVKGGWLDRTGQLVFATQASIADISFQEEVEHQADRLRQFDITLLVKGADELSAELRKHPEIVDDFFGRAWASRVLSDEQISTIAPRLDGRQFAQARTQLHKVLHARFQLLDPDISAGSCGVGQTPFVLLDRFVEPDILQTASGETPAERPRSSHDAEPGTELSKGNAGNPTQARSRSGVEFARVPLGEWLADGEQLAVVGEAGSGKSTLLRCIALDILGDQTRFPEATRRFGRRLPIHVPFARWAKEAERAGGQVSLKRIVAATLQPYMTIELSELINAAIDEKRILLLVDGLDEWSNEQAAATTLHFIQTVTTSLDIPAIVTGRPSGLRQIGSLAANWKRGELAPLTRDQQRALARRWFRHYSETGVNASEAHLTIQVERFMAELAQERGLSALAEVPLLLVSLVALSLRQLRLPRNRLHALQQLSELLLERHPKLRAGAADEVQSRFRLANDPELRREALEWLAFTIRKSGSDAGLPIEDARATIRSYLEAPETFALTPAEARGAASEILAINAETQGMLVEKATGEVGFVHATFEEYFSACRLFRLDDAALAQFVSQEAGNPRWRNAIYFTLAMMKRKGEVDALIEMIEAAAALADDSSNHQALLAEIAFGSVQTSPVKARQLAADAFELIRFGDWMPMRRKVLGAALGALSDPIVGADVSRHVVQWAPRRVDYVSSLVSAMSSWKQSPHLLDAFWAGLHSEEGRDARPYAKALAASYSADPEVEDRLCRTLDTAGNLSTLAAALEALIRGWPLSKRLDEYCQRAVSSPDVALQLTGIFGASCLGKDIAPLRDQLIQIVSGFPFSYLNRDMAEEVLIKHWLGDQEVIKNCLSSVENRQPGYVDHDVALTVLLHSPADNEAVRGWLRRELKREYHFLMSSVGDNDTISDHVFRFAEHDPALREEIVASFANEKTTLRLPSEGRLIARLGDPRIRDRLISIADNGKHFDAYWALRVLINGWGVEDSDVSALVGRLLDRHDDVENDIISLLPEIIPDSAACRARLFDIAARQPRARNDLLARAFVKLGGDGTDTQIVDLLLGNLSGRRAYQAEGELFRHFAQDPRVRALALADINDRGSHASYIAEGFAGDEEMERALAALLLALPDGLRGSIVDTAASDPTDLTLARLLAGNDSEDNVELKSRLTVAWARSRPEAERPQAIETFVQRLKVVGSDYVARRVSAWAGLMELDALDVAFAAESDEAPTEFMSRSYGEQSDTARRLAATRWDQIVRHVAGRPEAERKNLDALIMDLAPFIGRSANLRSAFLDLCASPTTRLSAPALRALRRERPGSSILLEHYMRELRRPPVRGFIHQREEHDMYIDVPRLLRSDFGGREDILNDFRSRLADSHKFSDLVPLALYAPDDRTLGDLTVTPMQLAEQYGQWALAASLVCGRGSTRDVAEYVNAMLHRSAISGWDRQDVVNDLVIERLQADAALANLLSRRLDENPSASEICSLPRYMSAAGLLGEELIEIVSKIRRVAISETSLSTIGLDTFDEGFRTAKLSLLDALAPRLAI